MMVRAALVLFTLVVATTALAADALTVEVTSRDGCPAAEWFREQLAQRGVRGLVRASLGVEEGGYAGEIEARAEDGRSVTRRLTGSACVTVAEGLLLVAEVHLAEAPSGPGPSEATGGAPQAKAPTAPAPLPPVAPPPPARAAAPFARLALGALGTVDTLVTGDPAFGGGLSLWLALGSRPLRGLALSGSYSRADVLRSVPVTHQHLRLRLDVLPLDVALDASTALGASLFLSGGALHVAADVPRSTPGGRPLWVTGAGVRLRRWIGPVFAELGVDATVAITRRSFVVGGTAAPLFSLPQFGVASTLALGVPLGS